MEVNVILQAISTVGFPICACGALFWLVTRQDEQHREEVRSLRNVLEQNTQAIIELRDLLKYMKGGSNDTTRN